MKLVSTMVDLEGGTASLGLFGDVDEDAVTRPPHVQVTVPIAMSGEVSELRTAAIIEAIRALEEARRALEGSVS